MKEYVTIKVINSLGSGFETYVTVLNEQARKENMLPELDSLLKSLEEEDFRMKEEPQVHGIRGKKWSRRAEGGSGYGTPCPHCHKPGHTEDGWWPLHPELASEHLREKFRKALEAKAKDQQGVESTRIGSMTTAVRKTIIC